MLSVSNLDKFGSSLAQIWRKFGCRLAMLPVGALGAFPTFSQCVEPAPIPAKIQIQVTGGSESPFLFYTHFSAIVREERKSDGELLECRVA